MRLVIDDTGSGYSSLTRILKMVPDFIKLDRDLVSGIDVDSAHSPKRL
jgi:EAL domain-containing protein (putative c-di-GMP-specific phosphodiesterase class I)